MTTLILHADLDCHVYIDTKFYGSIKAGDVCPISLERGAYWIRCVSQENSNDNTDFDFRTDGSDKTERRNVELKPIRYERLVSQYSFVGEFRCGFAEVKGRYESIGYINNDGDLIYRNNTFEEVVPFGDSTICVKKDGLWGVFNSKGEYIIEPQYRAIRPVDTSVAIFFTGEKYGLLNANGEIITPAQYRDLYKVVGADLIRCALNNKFALLDFAGNKITPLKYDWIGDFCENVATVKYNDRWGLVDKTGIEVLPCKYLEIMGFHEGLARVKYFYGQHGFVDKNGNEVIPCIYQDAFYCEDALIRVKLNDKWGLIDKTGKQITPCKYAWISYFDEGLAKAQINDYYYVFIDKQGNELFACCYKDVGDFKEGLAQVTSNYKIGFIDKLGNEVIPCEYEKAEDFKDGVAWVRKDYKWGLIDQQGNEIVPFKYYDLGRFDEGLARASLEDCGYGFIDYRGNEIIPFKYDAVRWFFDGVAWVESDEKWGLIDKNGHELLPFKYDEVECFIGGEAWVKRDNRLELIDKCGNVILHCERYYDEVDKFTDALLRVHDGVWFLMDKQERIITTKPYKFIGDFVNGLAKVESYDYKCGFIDKNGNEVIPCIYNCNERFSWWRAGLFEVKLDGRMFYINRDGIEVKSGHQFY